MRPSVQQPISKDKNVMARARKYYLKNNYLTLRSKFKVPQRLLCYTTHHFMVMHPHTKYHSPISKDNQRLSRACIVHLVIKKTNWSYVKTMSCSGSHLGITINIKNTKFVKDLPMIDA